MTAPVTVNGEPRPVHPGTVVGQLVDAFRPDRRGVAVALNDEVVPRSAWDVRTIEPGDRVEILTAAQGG